MLLALSAFSKGVPVKPKNRAFGQQRLHGLVQVAGLGPVALIDEDMQIALGLEIRGQVLDRVDERLGAFIALLAALPAELMDQRAEQGFLGAVQLVNQVRAAGRSIDRLIDALEDLLDLLVQLGAVGDDQHPGIGDDARVSTWRARPWSATCRCLGCAR